MSQRSIVLNIVYAIAHVAQYPILLNRRNDKPSQETLNARLLSAVMFNQSRLADQAIRQGADPDFRKGDKTMLMLGATVGSLATMKVLDRHGANMHAVTPSGLTVLMCAVVRPSEKIVSFILSKNVYTHARHSGGNRALDVAQKEGNKNIVQMLKEKMERQPQLVTSASSERDSSFNAGSDDFISFFMRAARARYAAQNRSTSGSSPKGPAAL